MPQLNQDELLRQQALASYAVLDTPEEEEFDRLTELASLICEVPITLISLLDEKRQWFKSRVGLEAKETPKEISFCQFAIRGQDIFVVEDATKDDLFKNNPLVTGSPDIRFYAGYPLLDPEGFALGTLCAIDRKPRKLSEFQNKALKVLSLEVVSKLIARKEKLEKEKFEALFKLSIDMIGIASKEGIWKVANPSLLKTLGYTATEFLGKPFVTFIHPDDAAKTQQEMDKLSKGEQTFNFTNRYRTKKGDYILINWCANLDPKNESVFAIGRDITQAKRVEEESLNNLKRMNEAQRISKIGSWEIDLKTGMRTWSDEIYEIYHFPKDNALSKYELLKSRVHEDDFPILMAHMDESTRTGKDLFFEFRTKKTDTLQEKYLFSRGYAVKDANQKPTHFVGITQDITEQKEQEKFIFENENKLKEAQSISKVGSWEFDLQTQHQYWSTEHYRIFEIPEPQSQVELYRLYRSKIHPDDLVILDQLIDKAIHQGVGFTFDHRVLLDGGTRLKYVQGLGKVIFDEDGTPKKLVGTVQDITERKLIDQELQKAKDSLSATFETIREGLVLQANDGSIVECNPAAEAILGLSKDQMLGKKSIDPSWRAIHEDGSPFPGETHPAMVALKTRVAVHNVVMGVHKPDSTLTWINVNAELLPNETGVVCSFADITERKATEELIYQAKLAAEAANKAKSEFLANMSHEIRTPLNSVLGFTELLKNSQLNAVQAEYVKNAFDSAHSLLGIVNDVLDLSKIEAGKLDLEILQTDLHSLVEQAYEMIKLPATQKNILAQLALDPELPRYVLLDPTRLKQILINLLSNALKFTNQGTILFSVKVLTKTNSLANLQFSVKDSGIGIPPESKENLFKAFSQADNSITRKFGGTGLGLTISNLLVHKMGGKIEVESHLNQGSEFSFSISVPLAKATETLTNQESQPLQPQFFSSKPTVLIVEDIALNMRLLKIILTNFFPNVELLEAVNGQEAVDLALKYKPHLILMDVQMPVMSGIEATVKIREMEKPTGNRVPIIALTAGVIKEDVAKCLEAGMDSFLSKPINQQALQKTVSDELGKIFH